MSLNGKLFVVAGGAGVAGESVASGLLRRGATVAITSRSRERVDRGCRWLDSPRLHGFVGDMSRLEGAATVRDQITDRLGAIDGVVASLGGWWEGPPLTELDLGTWERILADNLTSHFIAARTFLPALVGRPNAVYVTLGGVGATKAIPHAGPISVTGAAQTVLLQVLDAEKTGVRLHEVRIMTPIVTHRWDRPDRERDWLTGEEVGDYVASVVSDDFPLRDELILYLPDPDA
ncbi:MAG: SDR family oxidoreductase [Micromonosporaceae bacterium]